MRTCFAMALFFALTACGNNNTMDADPYATLQECFDDHHITESLSVNDSIVICCLDHPLGTAMTHPSCKNTVADCVTYLTSDPDGMLTTASAPPTEVMAACTDYISKKGM